MTLRIKNNINLNYNSMKTNTILALLRVRVKPTTKKNYVIVHSTVKNDTTASNGKNYKFVCESNLVFTKEQILELPDKQAELLEQILKLRKVTKKLKSYEDNFKTNK